MEHLAKKKSRGFFSLYKQNNLMPLQHMYAYSIVPDHCNIVSRKCPKMKILIKPPKKIHQTLLTIHQNPVNPIKIGNSITYTIVHKQTIAKFSSTIQLTLLYLPIPFNFFSQKRLCNWAYTWDLLSEPYSSFTSTTTPHGFSNTKIPVEMTTSIFF